MAIRFSSLLNRDVFDPLSWPTYQLSQSGAFPGWWEIDLDTLGLPDGDYEYEFVLNNTTKATDPYAESITRFGGYRAVFTIVGGSRQRKAFRWAGEFNAAKPLPQNNQIVIYEMPVKWMSTDQSENPLVELGTIDKVIFEHLDSLGQLGINCIELLPIQDTPQTLNWGYGTRFYFAPDYDIGGPVDLKFFVKECHSRGIRVILDVVMNMFAPECPLGTLALDWFYEPSSPGRADYGQDLFKFANPAYRNYFAAREFLCEMGEFWVSEYHIDGYRVDEFKSINNWEFVQEFSDRATARSGTLFPGKPFLVVAEDSNRDFIATQDSSFNPNGRKVVDAIWNFGFKDEVRRLLTDSINTNFGEPSRSSRVYHLLSKDGVWNDWNRRLDTGFVDMACSVSYITSHDVADGPRLANIIVGSMLQNWGLGNGSIENVKGAIDSADSSSNQTLQLLVSKASKRLFGGFALLMTSVGMPMFLAGEEFGDVHDTSFTDVNTKQEDPVQWNRALFRNNAELMKNVGALIKTRTTHPALQRNDINCFYFHPQFDDNSAPRVFAYCRTNGQQLGSQGQVVVIANMGAQAFDNYSIPNWRWNATSLTEVGYASTAPSYNGMSGQLSLSLEAFSVRVFLT